MLTAIFTSDIFAFTAVAAVAVLFAYLIIAMDPAGARNPELLARLAEGDKAESDKAEAEIEPTEPSDAALDELQSVVSALGSRQR